MKQNRLTKNRITKILCVLMAVVICYHSHCFWTLFLEETGAVAKAKTTQQQINDKEKEKKDLENQLNNQKEDIAGLKGEKKTLQKELNSLNDQMDQIRESLENLENQIATKEEEIRISTEELEVAIATEEWQYSCMVIRIRDMYERNDTSLMNSLLGAGSLSGVLNTADWFETIAAYDRGKLREFKENRAAVEELKATLETQKIELDNLKLETEVEKNKIAGLISQTSNAISDYADQIDEAEQKALEYEQQIKEKEEDLEYLKKVLEEEKRLSQAAANATWRNISEVTFADGDRYLLANLIYCEAGGEPYEGKLAVGSVVINRVLSSKYADTVVGVIYQKSQFSPVGSGRLGLALAAGKANADCYRAADEAMSGVTNVGNCVYFRTPVPGLTGISIGNHIFY